jgi:hypothetical protein
VPFFVGVNDLSIFLCHDDWTVRRFAGRHINRNTKETTMSRKKQSNHTTDTTGLSETTGSATAVMDPAPATEAHAEDGQAPAKNWGPPYKSIFSCPAKGFEMGEDRQFKQRVFKFSEKPEGHVLAALKEHGFTYRASEKAWTVNATAENRVLTDRLAREFSGIDQGMER